MGEAMGSSGRLAGQAASGDATGGHGTTGGRCPNCQAIRAGPFCQGCGQDGHLHHNLAGLGHDLLHGVFHFEGKMWNTLPLLLWRPGDLTRRYVAGERVRFVTPVALFLFSVFLLFAAVNRLPLPGMDGIATGLTQASEKTDEAATNSARTIADLQRTRAARLQADPHANVADLDGRIAKQRKDMASMEALTRRLRLGAGHTGEEAPAAAPALRALADAHRGSSWIDRQIRMVNENSALYAYKLKIASYKFSWALIPISVPFIWLLFFWRRDVGLYDHAIFAIHSLSFMTLLAVALIGLYLIGAPAGWLWLALVLTAPLHLFRHLKGGYRLGWFGALWRTAMMLLFTAFTSTLFLLFLLWLEAE